MSALSAHSSEFGTLESAGAHQHCKVIKADNTGNVHIIEKSL